MKNNKRKIVYIVVIVIAVIAIIFVKLTSRSAELSAMTQSPVTHTQLNTAREVKRYENDRETTLGKPIYPEVLVLYEPTSNYTKQDVFNEIVEVLNKNGWQKEELHVDQPGYYVATFPQDKFIMEAAVSIDSQSNNVSLRLSTRTR